MPKARIQAQTEPSITISDDQSVFEKVEKRKLFALQDHVKSQKPIGRPQSLIWPPVDDVVESSSNGSASIPKQFNRAFNKSFLNDDIFNMDLSELQKYIERLQARAKRLEVTSENQPPKYQTLHRILREVQVQTEKGSKVEQKPSPPFFDPPECVIGQGSARGLRCKIPVKNFDLFLEKNKDVSFIVYKNHKESDAENGWNGLNHTNSGESLTEITESIFPVAQDLILSLKTVLQSRTEYVELFENFLLTSELDAPYLFIYHDRKNLDLVRNSLNWPAQEHFSPFLDYVMHNYGAEYAGADSLISRGKIHLNTSSICLDLVMSWLSRLQLGFKVGWLAHGRVRSNHLIVDLRQLRSVNRYSYTIRRIL